VAGIGPPPHQARLNVRSKRREKTEKGDRKTKRKRYFRRERPQGGIKFIKNKTGQEKT
jgi:hypothetical protein